MRERGVRHPGQERRDAHHEVEPVSPGSLAYTEDEEAMLVRVGAGWQYVLVSERKAQGKKMSFISIVYSLGLW